MSEEAVVFGPSLWVGLVGWLFAIPGFGFALFILAHLVIKTPLMWMKPPGSTSPQAAGPGDLVFFASLPLIFGIFGLLLVLFWKNWRISLYSDGFIFRNMFGKERLRAQYEEITKIAGGWDGPSAGTALVDLAVSGDAYMVRGTGKYYKVFVGSRSVLISSYTRDMEGLVDEVRRRAPQAELAS
jgi:hypothetical protein